MVTTSLRLMEERSEGTWVRVHGVQCVGRVFECGPCITVALNKGCTGDERTGILMNTQSTVDVPPSTPRAFFFRWGGYIKAMASETTRADARDSGE